MELYDVETSESVYTYSTNTEKLTLAWHPSKYMLAIGGEDRKEKGDKNDRNEGSIHLVHPTNH